MADEQPGEEPQKQQSWALRQWQRWRTFTWRDVIIGQVGEGASNVVIGKNNVQINVGGRNLSVPIYAITLALLIIVGFLVYPLVKPIWWPSQMTGGFNIAIADFGVLTADGKVLSSTFGADLSKTVFDQLQTEYTNAKQIGAFKENLTIWQDSQGSTVKNVTFGVIKGSTEQARTQAAAALAQRINADMVIYGYLTENEDPKGLVVQFYVKAPTITNEPDAIVGRHRLGVAIAVGMSLSEIEQNAVLAKTMVSPSLAVRTKAMFWLTLALTHSWVNDNATALALLLQAEQALPTWKENEGKEVLYFFIGQQALVERRYDLAIDRLQRALALNHTYVNALITLGSVYADRAQLYYLRGRTLPAALAQCVDHGSFDQAATTAEAALADLTLAAQYDEQALKLAPTSPWPALANQARMALGIVHQTQGQAYIFANQMDAANQMLAQSRAELGQVLGPFTEAQRFDYLAWASFSLALANRLQAHINLVEENVALNNKDKQQGQDKHAQAITSLTQALGYYQQCLDQRPRIEAKPFIVTHLLDCGCTPYQKEARDTLDTLGKKP